MDGRIERAGSRFSAPKVSTYEAVLLFLVLAGLAYSLHALATVWSAPILEKHQFRQTQTALSAYWLLQGGPALAYQTPVVGAPWVIPFEFPLYQWCVAGVARLGVPLDSAGRLVSWLYYAASLPLAAYVLRRIGLPRDMILGALVLWLFSPLYVFWSRTFMIESCAVFLALAFLAGLVLYLDLLRRKAGLSLLVLATALMAGAAVLAALVKITTFFAFALAGGAITLHAMITAWRRDGLKAALIAGIAPGLAVLAALVATSWWVAFSDALKAQSPIGALLTSTALHDWNFGTEKLADSTFWRSVVAGRATSDAVGSRLGLIVALAGLLLPRTRTVAAAGLVLYVAPFLVFTNLHNVHNYYQYANALFLVLAVGAGVWAVSQLPGVRPALARTAAGLLLLVLAAGEMIALPYQLPPVSAEIQARTLAVAQEAARLTGKDEAIFVFGYEWSSEIAYYAQRRAVSVPNWATDTVVATDPRDLRRWIGKAPLGAVVDCRSEPSPALDTWIARLAAGRAMHVAHGCRFYS